MSSARRGDEFVALGLEAMDSSSAARSLRLAGGPPAQSADLARSTQIRLTPPVAELMRRERVYRRLLAGADVVAVSTAVLFGARFFGVGMRWPFIAVGLFAVLVLKVQGLYDRDEVVIRKSTIAEWRALLQAFALISICIYLAWSVITTAKSGPGMRLFLLVVITTTVLALIGRTIARRLARGLTTCERCLIIGDVDTSSHLAETIASIDGVDLVGGLGIDRLGSSLQDLRAILTELDIHRIVIVPDAGSWGSATLELVRRAKLLGVRVSILPTVLAAVGGCATFDELNGHTLLSVPRFGLSRSSAALKRVFDVVISVLALLLLLPAFVIIAMLIWLDTPGPVFFCQQRIGRNGHPFRMVKLRSMVDGADALKPLLRTGNDARAGLFKLVHDPRVTRVGRLLRASHLDELPQLFNVLRGQMSLVGPRPLIEEEDEQIAGSDRIRLSLTPGITGPWQICGPLTTPLGEMVKLDYLYISNWSIWRDIDILLTTVISVLRRHGY